METQNEAKEKEFHAVEFMRQARDKLSEKYLQNKTQYLEDLKKAMADFISRQEKAIGKQQYCQ